MPLPTTPSQATSLSERTRVTGNQPANASHVHSPDSNAGSRLESLVASLVSLLKPLRIALQWVLRRKPVH